MNIAIIGGGLTGLTAAYELLKRGHQVTVFEKGNSLGGLAGGFTMPDWQWNLEYFYHHFFTNDHVLISLAKELGLEKDMLILRPSTATLVQSSGKTQRAGSVKNFLRLHFLFRKTPMETTKIGTEVRKNFLCDLSAPETSAKPDEANIFQLDSPMNLLTFPLLSPLDKLRTGALLAFCKINPFWQPLEKISAEQFFKTIGGARAWEILWEPLVIGKFGKYAKELPASWLWARFHKRTMRLGYFRGGFRTFVETLTNAVKKRGGIIKINTDVASIKQDVQNKRYDVQITQKNHSYFVNRKSYFDKILITTPSSVASKLINTLATHNSSLTTYNQRLLSIPHLWAQTLILETRTPILDTVYWLNITDPSFPFIAVVAHTNMVDKKHYGGHHITYIGNYLPDGHPFLTMTKDQLLKKFLPYLRRISPRCNDVTILRSNLFTAPNAQPVHTINYSKKAPPFTTPIPGVYLANMDSIYPWDRGTNYAVELGQKAAREIDNLMS